MTHDRRSLAPARRLLGTAGALTVLLGLLAACATSPTTTYTDAAGETFTVDWSEYPLDPYTAVDDVLSLPTVEQVDERWSAIRVAVIEAIEAELDGEFGPLDWRSRGEDGWFPYGGNGYGGETMLKVYNSSGWEADVILPPDAWPRVLDAAERELAEWGIGPTDVPITDPDAVDTSDWLLVRDFVQAGEFLTVSVEDARRDDDALADAEEYGHQVSGISLFYGIQTIADADREAFIRAAAPFEGLARPEPTHSD